MAVISSYLGRLRINFRVKESFERPGLKTDLVKRFQESINGTTDHIALSTAPKRISVVQFENTGKRQLTANGIWSALLDVLTRKWQFFCFPRELLLLEKLKHRVSHSLERKLVVHFYCGRPRPRARHSRYLNVLTCGQHLPRVLFRQVPAGFARFERPSRRFSIEWRKEAEFWKKVLKLPLTAGRCNDGSFNDSLLSGEFYDVPGSGSHRALPKFRFTRICRIVLYSWIGHYESIPMLSEQDESSLEF